MGGRVVALTHLMAVFVPLCGWTDVWLPRQRRFVMSPVDRDRLKAHLPRVLHAEMTEPAYAVHGDDLSGARPQHGAERCRP